MGLEIVENLLQKHSFVAINFLSLCKDMSDLQVKHPIEWYHLQFHLQQQQVIQKSIKEIKTENEKLKTKTKDNSEIEKIVEQKLSIEIGKKIDIEKPLNVLETDEESKDKNKKTKNYSSKFNKFN